MLSLFCRQLQVSSVVHHCHHSHLELLLQHSVRVLSVHCSLIVTVFSCEGDARSCSTELEDLFSWLATFVLAGAAAAKSSRHSLVDATTLHLHSTGTQYASLFPSLLSSRPLSFWPFPSPPSSPLRPHLTYPPAFVLRLHSPH